MYKLLLKMHYFDDCMQVIVKIVLLCFSLSVEDRNVGTKMTGTYQVLDGDKGPEYGTPFSPTSGETIETNDLGNSNDLGESSPRSRSPELSLPSENGLAENEHVSTEKETSSASMFLIFVVY